MPDATPNTSNGNGAGSANSQASGGNASSNATSNADDNKQNAGQNTGANGGSNQQSSANQPADGKDNGDGSTKRKEGEHQPSKRSLGQLKASWKKEFVDKELPALIETALTEREQQSKIQAGDVDALKASHTNLTTEHKALSTRYSTLASLIDDSLDERVKDWPDDIAKMDPAKKKGEGKYTVEERLEWYQDHQEIAQKLAETNPTPPAVPPPAPTPQGQAPNGSWKTWQEDNTPKARSTVRF